MSVNYLINFSTDGVDKQEIYLIDTVIHPQLNKSKEQNLPLQLDEDNLKSLIIEKYPQTTTIIINNVYEINRY